MSEHAETSIAETERVAEKFKLPTGFVTEKGSAYSYSSDGRIHRERFDGTSHDMGLAVFIDDTPDNLDVLTRLGTVQDHLPPEKRKKAYILQLEDKDGQKTVKGKVYSTEEVTDPNNLAFALINGLGQIVSWVPANLQPKIGSHVFEIDKLDDGKTSRHPGHRVTDIVS